MAKTKGARGFGTVELLKSGRYRIRYIDPYGQRARGEMTYSTKVLAEKALARIQHAIETGTWRARDDYELGELDPKTITLDQLATLWRNQATTAQGRRLGEKTLSEYERLISSTLARFKDKPIKAITTQQVETWRANELGRGVLRQTAMAYKHLRQLMTYAQEKGWININPCNIKRAGNYKAEQPSIPTREQVELMIEIAPEPFRTLLAIASQGGLRKGEILELRRKDIDLKPGKTDKPGLVAIKVTRSVLWAYGKPIIKPPKSAKGVRSVLLPQEASELVRAHLRAVPLDPEALLFSQASDPLEHFGQFQLRPMWEQVREQVGFNGRFHSLRAYHLTQYALQGATTKELQDRAGHATPQMVMVYQHNVGREADLVEKLGKQVAG